jgi:hypothetical protein
MSKLASTEPACARGRPPAHAGKAGTEPHPSF